MTLKAWKKRVMTIILIGETGVGKTAFMSLLSNVCAGVKLEEFDTVHDKGNEAGGAATGSQTNKPRLYIITCANGFQIHILDTPGLADTRGIDKDNEHKAAIAESIKEQIETVDAVIVMANGTLERLGVATEYALTVISGMFPHSIIDNIGFVFTMVPNALSFNFQRDALPVELKDARIWTVDNPLAQWSKYQANLTAIPPKDEEDLEDMFDTVSTCYKKTLKSLNDFLKWLDERKVEPVQSISDLYEMSTSIEASISNVIARMDQAEKRRQELVKLQNDFGAQDQVTHSCLYPLRLC